jgi:hypothetical protein
VSGKKDEPTGSMLPLPLQFLAAWLAVWFARALQQQVDFLRAENQILKERLGDRKLQLTDADRRRLAVLGKELGRKLSAKVATIAAKMARNMVDIENGFLRGKRYLKIDRDPLYTAAFRRLNFYYQEVA